MSDFRLIALIVMLSAQGVPALAEQPPMTVTTLIDRAQIEDLLVDYYSHLGGGPGDFGNFYVADGILDVNGLVAKGQQAIEELYKQVREGAPRRSGTFRMLLTNPHHRRCRHGGCHLDRREFCVCAVVAADRRAGARAR
jgi:hypothetical protein